MKHFLILAGIFGVLAVILGAFGAHGLKPKITPEQLASYHTGVTYQFYHVFAIMATALLYLHSPQKALTYAAYSFVIGIVLFSGSIYLLALKDIIGIKNTKVLGPITPIGGMFFIAGWISFIFGIINWKS